MKKIQIKNLRSIKDTDEIKISKINILVGNNSSGKSTFLRIFPLLKQSFNKKINGPILWCGDDDDYVDFGSFEEAVNYNTDEKCIKIMFECEVNLMNNFMAWNRIKSDVREEKVRIEFSIMHSEDTGYDYIAEVQYDYREYSIRCEFSEKNEIKFLYFNNDKINLQVDSNHFFPLFYEQPLFDISLNDVRNLAEKNIKKMFSFKNNEDKGQNKLVEYITYIYINNILKSNSLDLNNIKKIQDDVEKIYKKHNKEEIEKWILLYYLPTHFLTISDYLRAYFNKVYYIAPVRATAERYYRLRNAAVKEVDCRGKNLPVFLNSLTTNKFKAFQEWTKQNLGFEVIKTTSEGHVSLQIKRDGQKKAVNLSDAGFGYSQILPIATQLWYIAIQVEDEQKMPFVVDEQKVPVTIVIEQPELHLHPGLQAKLIDIIIKVAKQGKVNFIIETHSETMINRVGKLISNNEVNNDDIGIIIFEKEFQDDNTSVKQGGFDEDGYLENWPIGFFEPEEV
ncbi:MAG: AAA family ATPase [Lachnospiraceae bacterium]|nr:AAA family ATPase [Lachnospiraceae bacterium]